MTQAETTFAIYERLHRSPCTCALHHREPCAALAEAIGNARHANPLAIADDAAFRAALTRGDDLEDEE